MTTRTVILSSLFCLILLPLLSHAKVNYISIHEIESPVRQPLSAKLNIVEKKQQSHQKSQLKFTLVNQSTETPLEYQRINDFMLRLKSPHYIIGKASILVYELNENTWVQTHALDISNSLTPSITDKKVIAKTAAENKPCLLTRQPKETLWSIASRYKDQWNVDVFSAMLAIYKSNLSKFSHQHIGQLTHDVALNCPSTETIAMMGEKAEMKAEFHRLNKR